MIVNVIPVDHGSHVQLGHEEHEGDVHDELAPLPTSHHPVTPPAPVIAPASPTGVGHTNGSRPKYAPLTPTNSSKQSSNLIKITMDQTFIMVWKNLQVSPLPTLLISPAKTLRWSNHVERISCPYCNDPLLDLHNY